MPAVQAISVYRVDSTRAVAPQNSTYSVSIAGPDLSERSWIRLIGASKAISSPGDHAKFLVDAAGKMPSTEAVVAAYLEVALSINSSGDHASALSALATKNELGERSLVRLIESVPHVS